jgi:outer membrane immunogenic protein
MGMLRRATIGLVALTSVGLAAIRADADGIPSGPAPAYYDRPSLWQGFYVGGHVGFGSSGDIDGVVGGVQAGYNWQANQIVYGIEADVSLSDISGGESVTFPGVGTASGSASVDWMATVRGRVGFLLSPRLLAYGTAGVGIARASADVRLNGVTALSTSETSTGFVYGVGLEGKLTETISARIEYVRLTGLDDTVSSDGLGVVRAGLNIKLGQ